MAQPINRVPPGLTSLLGIKAMGRNPNLLGDELLGTIELGALYGEAGIETITGTTPVANTVGQWEFTNSGTRPRPGPGELWLVRRVGIQPGTGSTVALPASTSYDVACCTINASLGQLVGIGASKAGTAGGFPGVSMENFVLSPVTALALWVHSLTLGTAVNWTYTAQIVRLTI